MSLDQAATKKSIRLRILKPQDAAAAQTKGLGYKKIDPFADTETWVRLVMMVWASGYKKIDPFADTETSRHGNTKGVIKCYKKIDPFADTETA